MKLSFESLVFSSALLVGCSDGRLDGGSTTEPPYACDNRAIDSTCAAFLLGVTRKEAAASCDGIVIETACPAERAVGVCTVTLPNGSRPLLSNTYYSDGPEPRTEDAARKTCVEVQSGTFRTM